MLIQMTDPFETLLNLQRALDAYRDSEWLAGTPAGGGPFPPLNVFRKGDDFVVVAELPGVEKSALEVQVKGNVIRLAGAKTAAPPGKASVHRRERLAGAFDRTITLPVEIDADGIKAEYRDGILALFVPRAEQDKAKTIKVA